MGNAPDGAVIKPPFEMGAGDFERVHIIFDQPVIIYIWTHLTKNKKPQ